MNFGEIIREVKSNIKEASADILLSTPDYINECLEKIAAEKDLPALRTVFMVTTDLVLGYVTLSNSFDGRLLYAGTSDGELNIVKDGIIGLLNIDPDLTQTGTITDVAIENGVLWYRCIPDTATVITCVGYYKPATLVNDADTPLCIPTYLHRQILVNGASAIAYSIIEEGLETPKLNTMFYQGEAQKGITALDVWLAKRKSNVGNSVYEAR